VPSSGRGVESLAVARSWPLWPRPPQTFATTFEPVFAAGRCAFPAPVQWFSVLDLQNGQWISGAAQSPSLPCWKRQFLLLGVRHSAAERWIFVPRIVVLDMLA
jgi:hypothetical protein